MVKKYWVHNNSYEDFVRFSGTDLSDEILKEYLILANSRKKERYIPYS